MEITITKDLLEDILNIAECYLADHSWMSTENRCSYCDRYSSMLADIQEVRELLKKSSEKS